MPYNVEVDTGYDLGGGWFSFEWTSDPPTQEGWYWVRRSPVSPYVSLNDPEIVYFSGGVRASGDEVLRGVEEWSHWLGPLPVPGMPKG